MGFSLENGYVPVTVETVMSSIMVKINEQFGTTYTAETFIGTNFYKYFYALAQRVQENEIKTSEVFIRLQQYIDVINARVSRPVNTSPGIIEKLEEAGYIASVKPMIEADAGKIHIAIDVPQGTLNPDYAAIKLEIGTLLSQITVGGAVTQGTQTQSVVISNGQSFDYKFNLPDLIPIKLRLTLTLSENNQIAVGSPDDVKAKLLANILSRYRLGRNFEPQRYFSVVDAPWAAVVSLEWSTNGGTTWNSTVFNSDYDELFAFGLADIELVEA